MLIITGMSGAGKSIALKTLEDMGYYCVDNLPVELLENFVCDFAMTHLQPVAVAIDSRNPQGVQTLPNKLKNIKVQCPVDIQLIFLNAQTDILARRFNESRRPHPLTLNQSSHVVAAIEQERKLLADLINLADITLDTSTYNSQELRDKLQCILKSEGPNLIITLQSFGFKKGIPVNADYVFDVRFLPNPHWVSELRAYSGTQQPIIDWLEQSPLPRQFAQETAEYLSNWLPYFVSSHNRAYLTICIGCTGGQHRSVYVTEAMGRLMRSHFPGVLVEHRDMRVYQPDSSMEKPA